MNKHGQMNKKDLIHTHHDFQLDPSSMDDLCNLQTTPPIGTKHSNVTKFKHSELLVEMHVQDSTIVTGASQ